MFMRAAVFHVLDQRVLAHEVAARDIARQQGGHELDRIVGFQVRRLVGDQGVGRGMALVEAVAGELGDQFPDLFRVFLGQPVLDRAAQMNCSRLRSIIASFFLLIALMQV